MTEIRDIPDMPALRAEIDKVDRQLMALFAHRHALIDRAAQIKRGNGLPARIDDRVEEVAMNANRNAREAGLDPDFYEALWRQLIEAAIAQEDRQLNKDRP
ncbi:chorismate mutase [Paracoccus sp. 1_MG-2023]|uniref:chorismate mutase n=1 Tax=unclassified Paracoccus (in: a-proteobacteria) TaxID=2688777 RepID=UPI001C088F3E|nr:MULTISPECIES: chorismate mutase [unclassified Paracoccus (in: a-proteobacteria)]MBU2957531.1 chorismate mutase [Paracoccus sp. C2R09]MDO6669809.1 chorismate mutase [Paracoccus sp. 1_MG-2023]